MSNRVRTGSRVRVSVATLLAVLLALALVPAASTAAGNHARPSARSCERHGKPGAQIRFELLDTGIASSVWEDGTIGLAIPIANASERTARDVEVTRVKVSDAELRPPTSLPVQVGDMAPEEVRQVAAYVRDRHGDLKPRYRVVVQGRYATHRRECRFMVKGFVSPSRVNDHATFPGRPGETRVQRPQDAKFPPPPKTDVTEPNAESPIMVPPGPERELFPPTPTASSAASPAGAPLVDIGPNRNSTSNNAGTPPDPNAARGTDNVVLTTFNTGISFSLDGGTTFTDINLFGAAPGSPSRTSFFPQSDGGLCCDQVVIYVPRQNLFVWLLQYWPVSTTVPAPGGGTTTTITQPNRLRIAWATPQAIAANFYNAWTYGDLTANNAPGVSSGLGAAANEWLDYPDLAYSQDRLYVGADHGFTNAPSSVFTGRRIVARLNLAEMANPNSTVVHYDFTELSGFERPQQDALRPRCAGPVGGGRTRQHQHAARLHLAGHRRLRVRTHDRYQLDHEHLQRNRPAPTLRIGTRCRSQGTSRARPTAQGRISSRLTEGSTPPGARAPLSDSRR